MFVPLRGTQTWCLHTKLYKFMWNILSNNLCTECRTDLTLGQMPYLFVLSIPCQFLDFIHEMVSIFLFSGMTVKTGNIENQ